MDKLIIFIEKGKPFFEKLSRNIYLRAIKDGFISSMPAVLFSSIFILIAAVPNIFGFKWSDEQLAFILKPYNYSMGILALLVAGTTAKSLTDSVNTRSMEKTNQINYMSTFLAAVVGLLILAADPIEGGFANGLLGTRGLLTAFLAAFITVNIYKVCIKNNVTIRLPEEVPPNIAQVFKDVIPFALSVLSIYGLDLIVRNIFGTNVAESVGKILAPLFSATDGYIGLAIVFGAYAFFWFVGIHGPSVVEPLIVAISYANIEANVQLVQAGMHADKILNPVTQTFVVTMGGTGATLVVPFMFMWLCKSKRNRIVGRASVVPTFFGVNEPILFGAPIGIVMGTALAPLSFVLAITLIIIDTLIYYPFVKVYDHQILEEERKGNSSSELKEKVAANFNTAKADAILEKAGVEAAQNTITKETNVLVLCAGGGTSGLLANALNKAAAEYNVPVKAAAGGYGAHREMLPEFDLVILAPQVASNFEDMKAETDKLGIKLAKTEGAQYIKLTRDGKGALAFVQAQFD
ncbi:TPA: PTS transporter subunit EIIC [Streptococcus pneumoniae]|nr:PTS transporter subunit EIIC [Streptococcus pneumoniae]